MKAAIINAVSHCNIGDYRTSILLESLLKSWYGIEVERYGYKVPLTMIDVDALNLYDVVFVGPGGLYLDFEDTGYSLFSFGSKCLNEVKARIISICAGFNYYDRPRKLWWSNMQNVFGSMDIIGLRTNYGIRLVNNLGLEAYYSPDPLLFIGDCNQPIVKNKVVCSFHHWGALSYEEPWMQYLKDNEYDIVNVDHESLETPILDYRDCDFVLTDRFHGCVLATAFGKPFFTLDYNCKLVGIHLDFGTDFIGNAKDPDILCLENFMNIRDKHREIIPGKLNNAKTAFTDFLSVVYERVK